MSTHNNCSKCASTRILELERKNRIAKSNGPHLSIKIGFLKRKFIVPTNYLCLDCGYIEQRIKNKEDLALIAKHKNDLGSYL